MRGKHREFRRVQTRVKRIPNQGGTRSCFTVRMRYVSIWPIVFPGEVGNSGHSPSVGRAVVQAIINQDSPIIIGVTILFSALVVAADLVADLIQALLDPRARVH